MSEQISAKETKNKRQFFRVTEEFKQKLQETLKITPNKTPTELGETLSISDLIVYKVLENLRKDGKVSRQKQNRKFVYSLKDS